MYKSYKLKFKVIEGEEWFIEIEGYESIYKYKSIYRYLLYR